MTVHDQTKADQLSLLPQVRDYWAFYQKGETVIPHGPNPYVLRYYISGSTREEIDRITEQIFRGAAVTDSLGQSVIYQNQITDYSEE